MFAVTIAKRLSSLSPIALSALMRRQTVLSRELY
jgi:hypothetical protein